MRRRDLQRVADPLAGREAGPGVRRPGRRMRAAVHEDRPVQRSHELDVIRLDVARQRILFFQDARAAEAAPLMRRRVRPALILRRAPDRFGRRVRPHAAGVVERNPEVVAEGRLAKLRRVSGSSLFSRRHSPEMSGGFCGPGRLSEGSDTQEHHGK